MRYLIPLLLIAIYACGKKTESTSPRLPEVAVDTPRIETISLTYSYPAYLQAEQVVTLIARVNGVLQKVDYTAGALVAKSKTLFIIEPQPYVDQLNIARASVKSARAQEEYARANYQRMSQAVKNRAVSEIDYLEAESSYNEAVAETETAIAQEREAALNLSYCYVKAPFKGRISKNKVDEGNYVEVSTELATIYKEDKMYVYFNMPYSEFVKLPANAPMITINDNSGVTASGVIDYKAPNVDLQTGTLTVRGIVKNPHGILLNGMYVTVTVPYETITHALLIPEASIGTNQAGRFVYIVNAQGVVEMRILQVGALQSNNQREIISGISAGEQYVTQALMSVRAGMIVEPIMK